jgi:hypothetical protein
MKAHSWPGIACAAALCAAAIVLLEGCPTPLTAAMFAQASDDIAPTVTIDSPAEGSLCANIVEVKGTAVDSATAGKADGRVRSLAYAVSGSVVGGAAEVAADGSFSFQFSTTTLGTSFTLAVTAVDWNGNPGQAMRPLRRQSGNGVPSFAAAPDNQMVTLTWDPVPHAARYDLRYTTNGSLPSEGVGRTVSGVTSPWVVDGLANGVMHVFQLDAVPEEGWPESLSDFAKAIPLSPHTLAPQVTGGIRQVRVEWRQIPSVSQYEVWRSTERDGSYVNLSGPIPSSPYVDTDVSNDVWYWYEVRPSGTTNALSAPAGARPDPFCLPHPVLEGSTALSNALGVAVNGSYAYVADGTAGLRIVDISHPSAPMLVGTCATLQARAVAVSGSYAYVADGKAGLTVVNVANPSAPFIAGSFDCCTSSQASASCVAVRGSLVCLGEWRGSGLRVFDVSTPTAPALLGTYPASASLTDVVIDGAHAYAAAATSGLLCIDLSNPSTPTLSSAFVQSGINAQGVCVVGTTAYVADNQCGLRIVDVSDPANPAPQGVTSILAASRVAVRGDYAFIADATTGVRVLDVSNPAVTPVLKSTYAALDVAGVTVGESRAYVAAGASGLLILDASYPSSTAAEGSCMAADYGRLVVNGGYAYTVSNSSGLRVFDARDPAAPAARGFCALTGATDLAARGSLVFISDQANGLEVVDVGAPAAPALLSTCGSVQAMGVALSGPYAFLACNTFGVHVFDVSNPGSPTRVAICSMPIAQAVAAQGSFTYVAGGSTGLRVVDASTPSAPVIRGTYSSTNAYGVAVNGSHAYVTEYPSGLKVIDISDPDNPKLEGSTSTAGLAQSISVEGPYVFLAEAVNGMEVFDVTDPTAPSRIAVNAAGRPVGLAMSGSRAYASTELGGFMVLDLLP